MLGKNYLHLFIKNTFQQLNQHDVNVIAENLDDLISHIILRFNISNKEIFLNHLQFNNYSNLYALLLLLLPNIDENKFNKIYKLQDIGSYTNIQYSKFFYKHHEIIGDKLQDTHDITKFFLSTYKQQKTDDKYINFYIFDETDIKMNLLLLKNTINSISNKLCVNWINVFPIGLDTYKRTELYKNTIEFYTNESIDSLIEVKNNKGLYIGDIYNTLINTLYEDIKQLKWLLYEKYYKDKLYVIIEIINEIFNVEWILQNKNNVWEELSEVQQNTFSFNIQQMIKQFMEINQIWLKQIALFFESFVTNETLQLETYKILFRFNDIDQEIERIENDMNQSSSNFEIMISINNISKHPKEFFNFLRYCLSEFKKTWYGYKIINNGKININVIKESLTLGTTVFHLSYKNIYNFAKSLQFVKTKNVVTQKNEQGNTIISTIFEEVLGTFVELNQFYKKLSNLWIGLSTYHQILIAKRLLKQKEWFNIMGVNKITYGYIPIKHNIQLNEWIFYQIKQIIIDVIFESLILKGQLTEFVPNNIVPDLYRDKKNPAYKKTYIEEMVNKYKNQKIYYWLTKQPYTMEYLEQLKQEDWYSLYTFNWISQILFMHHVLHNKIIFLTAGTGQGKTTQIPKLYLYTTQMLLHKPGRVLCSQPRIAITIRNANTVANQLGIPIQQNDDKLIQYQTKDEKHIGTNIRTFIKFATDKIVLDELIKNIYMKLEKKGGYLFEDKFDVIMIDESHEHNKNMDVILTLLRQTLQYNSSIRVAIVSATMEDDESIYRSYYRNIDDDFIYPRPLEHIGYVSEYNKFAEVDDDTFYEKQNIDKMGKLNMGVLTNNIVDRRVHISMPFSGTTVHNITDIYYPNDVANYDEAEKIAIDHLKKIMYTLTGDVILFSTSLSKIQKIVELLNQTILPANIIAIPIYRGLPKEWENKFLYSKSFSNSIRQLTVAKQDLMSLIKNSDYPYKKVAENTYKYAIIVATNIIEASLTIDSLKYVIDTGYAIVRQKSVYGFSTHVQEIAEMNRIQRRGRVGRVSDGTVFYAYKKDSKKKNKIEYKICTETVDDILFELLCTEDKQEMGNQIQTVFDKLSEFKMMGKRMINDADLKNDATGMLKIMLIQHFPLMTITKQLNGGYIRSIEFPALEITPDNITQGSYNIRPDIYYASKIEVENYKNGYSLATILDKKGTFFMIHPIEYKIQRHQYTREIMGHKVYGSALGGTYNKRDMFEELIEQNFINLRLNGMIIIKNRKFIVSQLHLKINELSKIISLTNDLEMNFKLIKTLCYSFIFNCTNEVSNVISLLINSGLSLSIEGIMAHKKEQEFIKLWCKDTDYSDLIIMNRIFMQLKKLNGDNKIFDENEYQIKLIQLKLKNDIARFMRLLKQKEEHGITSFGEKDKEFIANFSDTYYELKNSDKLNEQNVIEYRETAKTTTEYMECVCKTLYLNKNTIEKAFETYRKIKIMLNDQQIIKNYLKPIFEILKITSTFTAKSTNEGILRSFLMAYPNIIYKYDHKILHLDTYKSIYLDTNKHVIPNTIPANCYYFYLGIEDEINDEQIYLNYKNINMINSTIIGECLGYYYNREYVQKYDIKNSDLFGELIKY